MEQDKTKILSDLYAIRATMSVVAEMDDSSESEKKEIGETKVKIERTKSALVQKKGDAQRKLERMTYTAHIASAEYELKNARKELQDAEKDFVNAQNVVESAREDYRKEKEKRYKDSRHSFKHYFTFVPGAAWEIYCGIDAGLWFFMGFVLLVSPPMSDSAF